MANLEGHGRHCITPIFLTLDFEKKPSLREFLTGSLEKLAQLATAEALEKLQQALDAHEKRLAEALQHKTGRSALVGAQRKRIRFIQELITSCSQRGAESRNDPGLQA